MLRGHQLPRLMYWGHTFLSIVLQISRSFLILT
jgi:hypothetical protein